MFFPLSISQKDINSIPERGYQNLKSLTESRWSVESWSHQHCSCDLGHSDIFSSRRRKCNWGRRSILRLSMWGKSLHGLTRSRRRLGLRSGGVLYEGWNGKRENMKYSFLLTDRLDLNTSRHFWPIYIWRHSYRSHRQLLDTTKTCPRSGDVGRYFPGWRCLCCCLLGLTASTVSITWPDKNWEQWLGAGPDPRTTANTTQPVALLLLAPLWAFC